jgi:fructosamine-3-kinase
MSVHGDDISWQVLRRIVHDWLGTSAELAEVKALAGGSVNTTVSLKTTAGDRAVLKICQHRVDRAYIDEAYQLNVMRTIGLPAPQVYSCKMGTLDEPFSYLLMETLDGVDFNVARKSCESTEYDHLQMHLADLLRTLHSQTHSQYTRVTDGKRLEFPAWHDFYRHLYDAIWAEAEKLPSLPVKIRRQIAKMHERLDRFIIHSDCPRLIHGDLWATNVLARQDHFGKWWVSAVLDPKCKYAHFESEIAYMELFRTVTPAFLRAYQQLQRLPAEYHEVRKPIYQLYELINHVQLFGAEYVMPLLSHMDKINRLI